MRRILFTGGGGAGNEAIFRLFADLYDMHFADADPAAIDPTIPAERRHCIPMASSSNFVSGVMDLVRRLQIDLLVPGVDEELPALAGLADEGSDVDILVPDATYVNTMLDKFLTARTLRDKGLEALETITADDGRADAFRYPCIAKPRRGRGSRGVRIIGGTTERDAYLVLTGRPAVETVLQELASGQEYTVLMAADKRARLRAVVPVRVDVKRGITIRAETDSSDVVIRACRAIHEALPARGLYNIQCILTGEDGPLLPFEINPRISTTFCLAAAAGVDPMSLYLDNDNGDSSLAPFRTVVLRRNWRNTFLTEDE